MRKKKALIIFITLMLLIGGFLYRDKLYLAYIQLFRKNALLISYNDRGQYDGDIVKVVNGKKYLKAHYKNGIQEGVTIQYFANEEIKNEQQYKKDKKDGFEKEFYNNGVLNYKAFWKNDVIVGSEFHYSPDKKIASYDAFDMFGGNADNLIFYCEYDHKGKITKQFGKVFSENIYSKRDGVDSLIILNDTNQYNAIKDMYLTIATPPLLTSQIDIYINNQKQKNQNIKENTLIVPNAFTNVGTYKIKILGMIMDADKKIIKADTLQKSIKVVPL